MSKPALKASLCAALILLSWIPAVSAQAAPPAATVSTITPTTLSAIDSFINTEMQRVTIPGLALAVVRNGQIELAKGYGFANLEHQVPVSPETIFQSGSLGKQFTATAVMMLVEAGKIKLDAPLSTYIKDTPDSWKAISIRQLLSHTSGMTDYPADFNYRRDYSEDELLEQIKTVPLAFEPGTSWQYSNLGYVTLGILIGKVTGSFYGDFLKTRVFAPSGMKTTSVMSEAAIVPHRAAGYQLKDGSLVHQDWVSPSLNTTADGSLHLSLLDLVQWDATLYSEKLLKAASLKQMWTPVQLADGEQMPYGFGWSVREISGHALIEHGGAWQGFRTHIARYTDDKLSIIVLANAAQADATRIAHKVAALYNPELKAPDYQAIADTEPEVTAMFKRLAQSLAKAQAGPELFDAGMQKLLFPDGIKAVGSYLAAQGELGGIELVQRQQQGQVRMYLYRLLYPVEQVWMQISLDADGKINGLFFKPVQAD